MNNLAAQCGFSEDPLLAEREAVVAAIKSADLASFRSAWQRYQAAAEAQIETLPDAAGAYARAQIGLILAKADIWREAGDNVRYLEELHSARTYAEGMGYTDLTRLVDDAFNLLVRPGQPETHQALEEYEAAIAAYIEREQDSGLTDPQRGLLNLRLAECYYALLQVDPDQPEVTELLDGSLQSALVYLDGEPEQAWALRLLDQVQADAGE